MPNMLRFAPTIGKCPVFLPKMSGILDQIPRYRHFATLAISIWYRFNFWYRLEIADISIGMNLRLGIGISMNFGYRIGTSSGYQYQYQYQDIGGTLSVSQLILCTHELRCLECRFQSPYNMGSQDSGSPGGEQKVSKVQRESFISSKILD